MPKLDTTTPDVIRTYNYHGVDLSWREGLKDLYGTCPFCGTEGKFNVVVASGLFRCVKCEHGNKKGGGNILVFLRKLLEASIKETTGHEELAKGRKLLDPTTLKAWEVAKSVATDEWLVPGYSHKTRELEQLYKYVYIDGKYRLLPTPGGLGHRLHGLNLWDDSKQTVYVCEGPWDAMALWEMFRRLKETGNGLFLTANEQNSILAHCNVIAVPGCNTPHEDWATLFAGKRVIFLFDNDHPKPNKRTGKMDPPAAYNGVIRAAKMWEASRTPPESIGYLHWGAFDWTDDHGYTGYDDSLPAGHDIRDELGAFSSPSERIPAVQGILSRIVEAKAEWFEDGGLNLGATPEDDEASRLQPLPCEDYKTLVNAWRKAMKWTDGLDHGLVSMLACVASTDAVGSQLWMKIIGPASCGKTTLAEGVSVAKQYVFARSTIRGFYTGFKYIDPETEEERDISLAESIRGKTLLTKDGDTLIQSPNIGQILSEARDIYDGAGRTNYRQGQDKEYENHRCTWILCGTASLRSIDQSELGERFLDCVVMDSIDDELEDEILWRVANKADRNTALRATGAASTQHPPELSEAMQLTGGYVVYLREFGSDLAAQIESPEWALRLCTRLGKFVAFMRARPSELQDENEEREFAARLVEQIVRYAKFVSVAINSKVVDEAVMARVKMVALDTARGVTLDIAKELYKSGEEGLEAKTVALFVGKDDNRTRKLLKFMREIGITELHTPEKHVQGITPRPKWRLTNSVRKLYAEVMG